MSRGSTPFNVLVNYWWRETPRFLGQPQDALNHAILSIRDLPDDEKAHWRELFDYYVFGDAAEAAAHIPEDARSVLATADAGKRRRASAPSCCGSSADDGEPTCAVS